MATEVTRPLDERGPLPGAAKWLAALASAGLLYLCFFPVSWGWLAWVALVPLLCLVRLPGRPRGLLLAAYLGGLGFSLPALQWMRVADPRMYVTWVFLSVYLAAYWPAAVGVLRLIERRSRLPLALTFPVVWVGLEYVRWGVFGSFISLLGGSHQHDWPGGFSWYYLGHSQHAFVEVIQVADLTGVYGVSFLVAAVNALLFEVLFVRGWFRGRLLGGTGERLPGRRGLLVGGLAVGGLLLACLAYGRWRLSQDTLRPGPTVAFLQGSMEQKVRLATDSPDPAVREQAYETQKGHYGKLARRAARLRPDLIVWPETSYPAGWHELEPGRPDRESASLASDMTAVLRTPVLLGMTALVATPGGRPRIYNSAILVGRDARWKGRYDKIHRVPFGEYVPLGSTLPFLKWVAPYEDEYSVQPGERWTRFELGPYEFGVLICYEDTDQAMARPYVRPTERPVDFLLNISNDGWFDGTSEHDQHLAICRFRAVECRRSVGRAVNMGISAIIDSNGRVLEPVADDGVWRVPENAPPLPTSRWHEFKKVPGVLVGRLPIDTRESLYARIGDAFATGCLGALVLTLVGLALVGRRRVG